MGLIQPVSGTPAPTTAAAVESSLTRELTTVASQTGRSLVAALGFRFDPAPAHVFYVELSGILAAMFTECSGLSATRDVEEVVEGGVNNYVHKLPGRIKFDNITLKRGVGLGRALWDWFMKGGYDFHAKRINFSIIQGAPGYNLLAGVGMGSGMGKAKHWNVENAYPIKWELSSLSTSASTEVAIETLQIAHHGLSLSYEVGTPLSLTRSILG